MTFGIYTVLGFCTASFVFAWYRGKKEGFEVGYDQCQYDLMMALEKQQYLEKMEKVVEALIDDLEKEEEDSEE